MTEAQREHCREIIASARQEAAETAGRLTRRPLREQKAIRAVQCAMAVSLGEVFGLALTGGEAEEAVRRLEGGNGEHVVSRLLLGWLPAVSALAVSADTEALGWTLAGEFDREDTEG